MITDQPATGLPDGVRNGSHDPAPAATRAPARTVGRWLVRVTAWLVLLAMGSMLLLGVVGPTVVRGQAYTVLSGSMEPVYPVGSLVVVRPVDPTSIRIGDVITYQLRSGEPTVVTHRVVGVRMIGTELGFLTQGDANPVPDADPVRAVQVRGVVWYAVPGLGYVNHAVGGPVRAVVLPLTVLGLLGYAVVMFVSEVRDRRRTRRRDPACAP